MAEKTNKEKIIEFFEDDSGKLNPNALLINLLVDLQLSIEDIAEIEDVMIEQFKTYKKEEVFDKTDLLSAFLIGIITYREVLND